MALAVAFDSRQVHLQQLDLSQTVLGGVAGQCLLRQLHRHRQAHPAFVLKLEGCVTGTTERQAESFRRDWESLLGLTLEVLLESMVSCAIRVLTSLQAAAC